MRVWSSFYHNLKPPPPQPLRCWRGRDCWRRSSSWPSSAPCSWGWRWWGSGREWGPCRWCPSACLLPETGAPWAWGRWQMQSRSAQPPRWGGTRTWRRLCAGPRLKGSSKRRPRWRRKTRGWGGSNPAGRWYTPGPRPWPPWRHSHRPTSEEAAHGSQNSESH